MVRRRLRSRGLAAHSGPLGAKSRGAAAARSGLWSEPSSAGRPRPGSCSSPATRPRSGSSGLGGMRRGWIRWCGGRDPDPRLLESPPAPHRSQLVLPRAHWSVVVPPISSGGPGGVGDEVGRNWRLGIQAESNPACVARPEGFKGAHSTESGSCTGRLVLEG